MNDITQSFPLNVYNLNPYNYGLQSILLSLEVQFVSVYFHVFLRPMFFINFHVSWEELGIEHCIPDLILVITTSSL